MKPDTQRLLICYPGLLGTLEVNDNCFPSQFECWEKLGKACRKQKAILPLEEIDASTENKGQEGRSQNLKDNYSKGIILLKVRDT